MSLSTKNTAAQENRATVTRLFFLRASKIAVINPANPDITDSVAYKIAGKVIAARQA